MQEARNAGKQNASRHSPSSELRYQRVLLINAGLITLLSSLTLCFQLSSSSNTTILGAHQKRDIYMHSSDFCPEIRQCHTSIFFWFLSIRLALTHQQLSKFKAEIPPVVFCYHKHLHDRPSLFFFCMICLLTSARTQCQPRSELCSYGSSLIEIEP